MAWKFSIGVAILVLYLSKSIGTEIDNDATYNLAILAKLMRGICWYETLKRLPPQSFGNGPQRYDSCIDYANKPERNMSGHSDETFYDSLLIEAIHGTVTGFSDAYRDCTNYWVFPEWVIEKGYYPPEVLEDKENYKYRSLAHCILHVLEDAHGSPAITELVSHWKEPKPTTFLMGMLNRENELRAYHGVPELLLDHELTKQAQLVAEDLAEIGKVGEVHSKHSDSQYQVDEDEFEPVGESVEQIEWYWFIPITVDNVGAAVASKWYLENEHYPWPAFKGEADFKNFSRFTQQVWKGTKRVGYGYAKMKGYIDNYYKLVHVVARYWPAGNPTDEALMHLYEENVLPPANSASP